MAPATDSLESRNTPMIRWSGLAFGLMILGLVVPADAEKYGGGTGSGPDPYLIRTAEDLDTLGQTSTDWDKCFKLAADIDLKDYNEKNFHLIGSWVSFGDLGNRPFGGIFDGNDRTISNFHYKDMKANGVGLFRYVNIGEIRNLRLTNVKVVTDGGDIGSLVGRLGGGGVVNCHIVNANVTGNTGVGGLVGSADGMVAQCSSQGRVAGIAYVGGLVGELGEGTVQRSYSKASVSGNENVGGLVGATINQASIVDSCYANGPVSGAAYAGGLIGQTVAGRVFRCYCAGAVTGSQYAGGLTGNVRFFGDVIASFWDTEASGQSKSGGGTAKTTAQMRSADTYSNWDFDYIWSICEGRNYPVFLWQIPTADLRCPDGVNATDFAWFAMQWNHSDCGAVNSYCEWADFDESGDVGFPDLAILAEDWLTGVY